jgi:HTH-type transcriptional regulator/antitoxin HipB
VHILGGVVELRNARELGEYVRDQRRSAGLSQHDLAVRATVSRRWLAGLEGGKPTAEVGLVFKVISALGLYLDVRPLPEPQIDLDAFLDGLGDQP